MKISSNLNLPSYAHFLIKRFFNRIYVSFSYYCYFGNCTKTLLNAKLNIRYETEYTWT